MMMASKRFNERAADSFTIIIAWEWENLDSYENWKYHQRPAMMGARALSINVCGGEKNYFCRVPDTVNWAQTSTHSRCSLRFCREQHNTFAFHSMLCVRTWMGLGNFGKFSVFRTVLSFFPHTLSLTPRWNWDGCSGNCIVANVQTFG